MCEFYIRHKTDRGVILICDQDFNPVKETIAAGQKLQDKACYISLGGYVFGVYPSVEGPVMFIDSEKYLFTDERWAVSVQPGREMNKVVFSGLRSNDFNFEYPTVNLDPLDPWSEEEFDDYFKWLSKQRSNAEFIRMWTLKI
ncbi:hypothetical protein [Pseudomonas sp. NPDC088444]|uniref:hypothetical protein n=1 Tax=Pseudomonas sp. NPDC088444 TaxID=3364456 RepID=UPI00384FEFD8